MRVAWLSGGVSSFIAAYLAKPDRCIYIDVDDQHPDTMRFIRDCEEVLGMECEVLRSEYGSVENVARTFGYLVGPHFAKCTEVLKRRVRKEWESRQTEPVTYVWGYDAGERHRAERLLEAMPQFGHEFPLIDANLAKDEVHGMAERLGVKRPAMYDMGYRNNNCVGCVRGGKGYWNAIRRDFPDVFASRSRLERDLGAHIIKDCYLDELEPDAGRMDEVVPQCGIMCELSMA